MSLRAAESPLVEYRGQHSEFDDLMKVRIHRFSDLSALTFDLSSPGRYIVVDPSYSLPLDFLLIPGNGERLLVGFHGAEDRANTSLPKFQFVSSLQSRGESVLVLSDPTLLHSERMTIGWFSGNSRTPLADLLAVIVRAANSALGTTETVLVGHSAGGFAAILVGMQVENSRAISVNGQTVALHYYPWIVEHLQEDAYPECLSPEGMVERYPNRFDLRAAAMTRVPTSSFTYFAHRDDPISFEKFPHFQLLADHFEIPLNGGRTANGDAFVPCAWELLNPSPHALPGTIMPFVHLVLGEKPSRDIQFDIDPAWRTS